MVDLVTSNTDFYSGRNRQLVHQLCTYGDVLLLQEAKDMTLRDVLPADWRSLQNTSSDAKKGSCIAVDNRRVKVLEHYLTVGCGPPPGGGMMTRYIATAVCEMRHNGAVFTAISAHYPPRRYAMQWEEYTTSLKRVRANVRGKVPVIGTDANMPIGQLAAKLNSKAYGVGIIGFVTSAKVERERVEVWPVTEKRSDHPAYVIRVNVPASRPKAPAKKG